MFEVSLLSEEDIEKAYQIEKEVNLSPWSEDNFFSSFAVGHHSLSCKSNGKLVGFLIYSVVGKECHLLNISVRKTNQRSGAGKLLMITMFKQIDAIGCKKVFLEVRSKNIVALNFYKGFGFKENALRIGYYSGEEKDDAILMSLNV